MKEKFPGKSFDDLGSGLGPEDIISYAYFLKEVEYPTEFTETNAYFDEESVKGFYARNNRQKDNVNIMKYWDNNKFIINLKLKDNGDKLVLIKGFDMRNPVAAIGEMNKYNNEKQAMGSDDIFRMPNLHLDYKRNYKMIENNFLANAGFTKYRIASMYEKIKFDIDYRGARVENEGVIGTSLGMVQHENKYKKLVLNEPFWLIMKGEKSQEPYFILGVKNTEIMGKVD